MLKKILSLSFFIIIFVVPNIFSSDEKMTSQNLNSAIAKLESFVQEGMEQSHVPGVAIAVVYQDEVVYVKGFGYRNIEKKLEVTPNTIFQLASVSKPITSTILAILVGEEKIDWDGKIERLNPSFRLSDPWVTSQLTIRDLLSHRSGLPDHAGDILEDLGYPQDEIYHRLRYINPLNPFRASYAYTNFGFSEAAFASSKYLKTSWNDLAKEKLFARLGMNDSSYSFDDYFTHPQKATTYFIDNGKISPQIPPRTPDSQRPAGGVSSSANDIAKWMILQMGGFQKKKIVEEKALKATQTPVIVRGTNDKTGLPTFYGMGWDISYDQEGRYFLKHSGSFFMGVRTQVALLPEEKLGIAILVNANPTALPEAVSTAFYDLLFKGEIPEGIVEKYNALWMEHEVDPQVTYQKDPATYTPPLPLEKYTGRFSNDYFGEIDIRKTAKGLELVIGPKPITFPLNHLTRDVFTFTTQGENRVGETQVIFSIDEEYHVRHITIDYLNKFGMGTFKLLPIQN